MKTLGVESAYFNVGSKYSRKSDSSKYQTNGTIQNQQTFKQGRLNMLAVADSHGINKLENMLETITRNVKSIFPESAGKSTENCLIINGDWGGNQLLKGYLTNPDMSNGDIQHRYLKMFIQSVRGLLDKASFETLFTLGNHDLDGGDKCAYSLINNTDMTTILTNADVENSPQLKLMMEKNKNIVKSTVKEIQDDKNPDLKHKVLFVSATIPSMMFYNPGLLKDLHFFDDCNKKDAKLKKEDLSGTIDAVKKEVDKFKSENPNGAVVLLSHTGAPISKMIREEVPAINVIWNGHDHKDLTSQVGNTTIASLGQSNKLAKSMSLHFNDDGILDSIDMTEYHTKETPTDKLDVNPISIDKKVMFSEDVKPMISLTNISGDNTTLPFDESIRYQNSPLANYLTSAIKRSVRDITNNHDVIVGIPSSVIRSGINHNSTNDELMSIFNGVGEGLSGVRVGTISGEELVGLVTENIKGNLEAPTRNTIIQWSDIQVNRTLLSEIEAGKSDKKPIDAIKVRTTESGREFVPVDPEKGYTLALNDKFLMKDDIEWPLKIKDRFVGINKTYNDLFKDYIALVDYQLKVTQKTNESRII